MRLLIMSCLAIVVLLASCESTPKKLWEVARGNYTPYYERDCAHLYPLYFDRLRAPDRTKVQRGWANFAVDGARPALDRWTTSPGHVAGPTGLRPGTRTIAIQGLRRIEDPPDGSYYSGPPQEFLTDVILRDYDFKPGEAYALLAFWLHESSFMHIIVSLGKRGRLTKFVAEPGQAIVVDGTRLEADVVAAAAELLNAASAKEGTWTDR